MSSTNRASSTAVAQLTINCPIGPVQPGSTVTATGTTPDCANTTGTVTVDGTALQSTFDCSNGRFTLTAKAPQCSSSSSNIMIFRVVLGDDDDSCSVAIDCDDCAA